MSMTREEKERRRQKHEQHKAMVSRFSELIGGSAAYESQDQAYEELRSIVNNPDLNRASVPKDPMMRLIHRAMRHENTALLERLTVDLIEENLFHPDCAVNNVRFKRHLLVDLLTSGLARIVNNQPVAALAPYDHYRVSRLCGWGDVGVSSMICSLCCDMPSGIAGYGAE